MPFNFPIFLTWLRIVLIPLIVGVFYLPDMMMSPEHRNVLAMLIFVLAALTDWLDGYLARKLDQTSAFGAFLDPVADKLMVTAALLVLVQLMRLNAVIALVIVGTRNHHFRAARVDGADRGVEERGREFAWQVQDRLPDGRHPDAAVLRTAEDMPVRSLFIDTRVWGLWLIYVAAFLTVWSMLYYMKLAWPQIRERGGML
jgi:cardiolipin synthase